MLKHIIPLKEDGRMTSRTKKDASTHQNISEVKPLTPEEVDEMLLHDDTYESDKVLMKCDRCGCEMELDGYILSEIAEADGEDELSCICMKCGKGTMHQVKK
jgi:hypothetical protein